MIPLTIVDHYATIARKRSKVKSHGRIISASLSLGAAALFGFLPSSTALAQPTGTIVNSGNMCVDDSAKNVGYCLNVPDGEQVSGHTMQTWQRDSQGEPNNDWDAVRVGTVSATYPFPPVASGLNSNYINDPVVVLNFWKGGVQSNYCAYVDNYDTASGIGTVLGGACNNSDNSNELLVQKGNYYIAVSATVQSYSVGDEDPIYMEGDFTSGEYVHLLVWDFAGTTSAAHYAWNWYPCFGSC
jgi:hypothetical protein